MSAHQFKPLAPPSNMPGKTLFYGLLGSNIVWAGERQDDLVRVLLLKGWGVDAPPVLVQADNIRLLLAMMDDDLVTADGIVGPVNPWHVLKEIALCLVSGKDDPEKVASALDGIVELAKEAFLQSGREVPVHCDAPKPSKIITPGFNDLLGMDFPSNHEN